ncbi:RDD family protein [Arthrobacter sp. NEB 688]|uniref:RDD family protein n=1 Tax=Arthrobacter sp. NEB 688 TaxID=904039 RepID=UPI0015677750|nr:RDD family protein [Arthrobacter sp. NEB 688]QKE86161.1 DUF2510 domain-containing protein [Arthrobacter sp. NEB 688]
MTTPSAPGWYEDPDDAARLRYFDGIVWSSHTTPRHPQPPAPAPTTADTVPPATAPGAPTNATGPAGPTGNQTGPGAPWGGSPQQQPWGQPSAQHPHWQQAPADRALRMPDGDVVAEWWRRLLAWLVDWLVTGLLAGVASLPFLGPYLDAVRAGLDAAARGENPDFTVPLEAFAQVALPIGLIQIAVGLVYSTLFLVWRSATPGKMLLGTIVRPTAGRARIGVVVALRRQSIGVVSDLLQLNPLLNVAGVVLSVVDPGWLLRDPRRQALHDKVADTVVVLRKR